MVDKFCDRDFGFKFASRLEYTKVKTTTLSSPNLRRNKTVNTYINYSNLEFNSGESFSKLKVNAKLDKDFTIFRPQLEIGSSIRFNIENANIDGILDLIKEVNRILSIPDDQVKYKIPLFHEVKDSNLLDTLNDELDEILLSTLVKDSDSLSIEEMLVIPELEIIGSTEVFNDSDDVFNIKLQTIQSEQITNLSIEEIKLFCRNNAITRIEQIKGISILRYRDGSRIATRKLLEMIEYTNDEEKCIFFNNKWYMFNSDYLDYLNESISQIPTKYFEEYDFNNDQHSQYINSIYKEVSDESTDYLELNEKDVISKLKKKYYYEYCFNLNKGDTSKFVCLDRKITNSSFELADLYEIETATIFAVKKGKSSADLCYAIDQSITALTKIKHKETDFEEDIKNIGLWFILERKKILPTLENNLVDLSKLEMLMLKNRIDNWKKEVRLAGYKPVIYINYRN